MPREIITLQAGQCGNQSKRLAFKRYDVACQSLMSPSTQLEVNSGASCVPNMESAVMALWKILQLREVIERMYSSTR